MILSAANTYTGPTSVNEGTLRVNGSTAAASALSVASTATLGGSGTVSGAITVDSGGTLAPGNSVGTLTAGSAAINGTLAIELDGGSADRLNVTGNLNITNATLALSGTPTAPELILAGFGSLTGSAFSHVTGMPNGYQVTYDLTNQQIKLSALGTGFAGWIGPFGVSNPAADADPDFDGIPNAIEYILGGDPSQPGSSIAPTITTSGGNLVFTFQRVDPRNRRTSASSSKRAPTLATWPDTYTIGATALHQSGVTIQENGSAPDTITVTIPQTTAKFARLRAVVIP